MTLAEMTKSDLEQMLKELQAQYNGFKSKNLKLDMSRGKPAPEQLEYCKEILYCLNGNFKSENGIDVRNYGMPDGIPEAKRLFAQILEVDPANVIVGGNSSLSLMFDIIGNAYEKGVLPGMKPWSKVEQPKFLCPVPGYDRHFSVTKFFGFEMINIPMNDDGPDMDLVEELVSNDESIKGIWCVPKYSNPSGVTYSETVVKRLGSLKPAAKDFRIFCDNAYVVHHLNLENQDKLYNIYQACVEGGNEDMVYLFTSTSKITFPGSGVCAMAASPANVEYTRRLLSVKTIGYNKLNQLLHARFLKDIDGVLNVMVLHATSIRPKFAMVQQVLNRGLAGLGCANWSNPHGGYFVSFDTMEGCAKRVYNLCVEAGVTLTPAGATYPYGIDPSDCNIRISPTYPPINELEQAMELLAIVVKIVSIEKLLA